MTPSTQKNRSASPAAIVLNVLALLLLAGAVLSLAFPSTEAARLRNAFLIDAGDHSDFDWTPQNVPATFLSDQRAPLPEIAMAARGAAAPGRSDWEVALAIAGMLTRNAKEGGAIRADLATTYRSIIQEGRGYCVDYVDVYAAVARAAGLATRQWAFSFDGFGGEGHTFVEVFDRQRNKWLFLDVFNNVHAVDVASGEPLSALQFREYSLGRRPAVAIRANGPGRVAFKSDALLADYYRRGAGQWYLWWGDPVVSHRHAGVGGPVSRVLDQAAALATGSYPRIKVLPTPGSVFPLERMHRLRAWLIAAAVAWIGLFALLVAQVVIWMRGMRRRSGVKERAAWA